MNDKRESSLAITEKKPHKPGGCVGIFFQLFDWNRRFAKKKLFSKKLLPPARPSKAPRKFGSDDKLPKHRLIANENSGGFPNAKRNGNGNGNGNPTNERKSGTKAPGLVARLMGLESMPAVRQDESKNCSFFDSDEEGFRSGFNYDMFDKEEVDKAMVCGKHEVRPQKLQKTGVLERQPLTRFGAEALQFRNVLSRSRKHHPKLASPVKSPRMSTGRNSSRLFDAAARILEPGLQATSRAKCTIAYSRSLHHSPNAEVLQETKPQSPNFSENCNYHVSAANALSGQSCRNCGSSLEEDAVPFAACASNYVNPCFQNSDRSDPMPASSFSFELEKVKAMDRCKEKSSPLCAEARNGVRSQTEAFRDRNPFTQEGPQRHSATHQFRSQKNDQSLSTVKNRARQNQVMRGRDRAPPKSSSCHLQNNRVPSATNAISERKNAVLKSQNLTSRARSRVPVKVETNGKSEGERRACNKQDCPLSPVRKRRPGNVNPQGESSAFVSPDFAAQRNSRRDVTTGKGLGLGIHSVNRSSKRNIMSRAGVNNKVATTKDDGIVAFTFKSPMKQKSEGDFTYGSTRDYSLSESTDRNSIPDNLSVVTGDALGALLEQKLKELTSQCEDDLTAENTPPKRTTAIILQELISALNAEKPETHDDTIIRPNQEKVSCHDNEVPNRKLTFQDNKRTSGGSVGYCRDIDRHSPGSILEASFSNDSCLSSSLDDSSGPNQYPDSVDTSYNGSQTLEADAELWDSVTSIDKQTSGLQLVIDLSQISGVFFSLGFPETAMYEIKLAHAKEVILNTEFVFRNLPHPGTSERRDDFSLSRFLTGELEALGSALSANDVDLPTFVDMKDGNQLRQRFLFDCAIEYLESIYAPYSNTGFAAWRRLPSCMTNSKLISGAVYEVRRWARFAGMSPDEIIERDMSHSSGKWTDFEVEGYESGAELCDDLLQVLVDEVISDFDKLGAYGM